MCALCIPTPTHRIARRRTVVSDRPHCSPPRRRTVVSDRSSSSAPSPAPRLQQQRQQQHHNVPTNTRTPCSRLGGIERRYVRAHLYQLDKCEPTTSLRLACNDDRQALILSSVSPVLSRLDLIQYLITTVEVDSADDYIYQPNEHPNRPERCIWVPWSISANVLNIKIYCEWHQYPRDHSN